MERKVVPSSRSWVVGRGLLVKGSGEWFRMWSSNAKFSASLYLSHGFGGYRGCNQAREGRRIPLLPFPFSPYFNGSAFDGRDGGATGVDVGQRIPMLSTHRSDGNGPTSIEEFRCLTPCAFHAARLSFGCMISSVNALPCVCYAVCSQIRWSCVSRLR